ncbi:hypothetical protein [Vagococcus hydrophili]|uniref:Uncharacterized protein n=1 Tax=Vagococcus hydrophili TaxID=2714947 RepID=A0A6G8ARD5_9ENTE|nr:hypothetical protein [Vagococcus hydrophili]QIL47550.1 hypothetical protein G7082_02865 [Vagococcus hydrophili]
MRGTRKYKAPNNPSDSRFIIKDEELKPTTVKTDIKKVTYFNGLVHVTIQKNMDVKSIYHDSKEPNVVNILKNDGTIERIFSNYLNISITEHTL